MNAAIAADRDPYQRVNNYQQDDSTGGKKHKWTFRGDLQYDSLNVSFCLSCPE